MKMKKLLLITLLATTTLFATDYDSMSIDELNTLRGTVPTEDRDSYRSAMQSKMQTLTPEERSSYRSSNGKGSGQGKMLRDGSGGGNMYKGSRNGGFGGGGRH
jgi:hypothetical protein